MISQSSKVPDVVSSFFGLTRAELESDCIDFGISRVHASDLYRSAYKEQSKAPWERPGLPKRYVDHCLNRFDGISATIAAQQISDYDGSVKFAICLRDQKLVEAVLMPESKRVTLCISSQVGCGQACVFCHTGRMGLLRNLDASEIISQIWLAQKWIKENPNWLKINRLPSQQKITNIVFMGMGEPLDNPIQVAKAITIMTDSFGMNLAKRRISVSTAGHVEGLERLLEIHPDVRLAVSVHSAFDSERSKIMPINRRWPLADLFAKLRSVESFQKNGILLQYTLIAGVNDSVAHAEKLLELTQGMNIKINIIPLNPVGPSRLKGPDAERLVLFRDHLFKSGVRVMVRYSKGQDIAAACGQLVSELGA
jgi:23S rRNA (adenine2503-C2)-methyltransferase